MEIKNKNIDYKKIIKKSALLTFFIFAVNGQSYAAAANDRDARNPKFSPDKMATLKKSLANVDVNKAHGPNQVTQLMVAAQKGNTPLVELLLDARAEVNKQDKKGNTAIMEAAEHGHDDIVQLLLRTKADFNSPDANNWTPLMAAIQNKHDDVIYSLLEVHATISLDDSDGHNALQLAYHVYGPEHQITIRIKEEQTMQESSNARRCKNGFFQPQSLQQLAARTIIKSGLASKILNINEILPVPIQDIIATEKSALSNNLFNDLFFAIFFDSHEMINEYVEKGKNFKFDINYLGERPFYNEAKIPIQLERTLFMCALAMGTIDTVRLLLKLGADVTIKNKFGLTALMIAAEHQDSDLALDLVELLLTAGAQETINLKDNEGACAIDYATRSDNFLIAEILEPIAQAQRS